MKSAKREAVIFTKGKYDAASLPYYRKLCRNRLTIAADAGYDFFRKTGVTPDVLIGDFDSLRPFPARLGKRTQVIPFQRHKNESDTELALLYCLHERLEVIDIVVPQTGEIDHFLALLLAPRLAVTNSRRHISVWIRNLSFDSTILADARLRAELSPGQTVSILPISRSILLTCRGMEYDCRNQKVAAGQTLGLRNVVRHSGATIAVKGECIVVLHRRGT